MAGQGADLLIHTLRKLQNGQVEPLDQGTEGAVYAPKLTKTLSALRWDRDLITVHNQIRALQPWPGTMTYLGEIILKVTESRPTDKKPRIYPADAETVDRLASFLDH